jgi:hypothetical protein
MPSEVRYSWKPAGTGRIIVLLMVCLRKMGYQFENWKERMYEWVCGGNQAGLSRIEMDIWLDVGWGQENGWGGMMNSVRPLALIS